MKRSVTKVVLTFLSVAVLFSACRKKDAPLPDNLVNFETNAIGLSASENEITVKLKLVRAVNTDIPVVINLTETEAVYGTDYTTTPAAVAGKVTVTVPSGASEASFKIVKVAGALFDGDEKIELEIYSSGTPVIIGQQKTLSVGFGEIIASNPKLVLDGGGVSFSNKVFVDLSANRQTSVARTFWHLGFYGGNDFKVILNEAYLAKAWKINKTDISTPITTADTIGSGLNFGQYSTPLSAIDDYTGSLSGTAFGTISSNEAENKVFICSFENESDAGKWYRVKVTATATGYKVQYALYNDNAAAVKTVNISKNPEYNQTFLSLGSGNVVTVEPKADKWDFAWSYSIYMTGAIAYAFQDFILLNNLGGTEVATVMTSDISYDNFNDSKLNGLSFSNKRDAIGSTWRAGGGPTTAPSIRTDRFYIIKDADGNYYKLRFTALTNNNAERGHPAFEAVLVKKA